MLDTEVSTEQAMDWFERLTGFQESLLSADVLALLLQLMLQPSCDVSVYAKLKCHSAASLGA
jgi:hypothetical protein